MKRFLVLLLLVGVGLDVSSAAFAGPRTRRKAVVVRRGPDRTTVVVHRGWPIRRAMPLVVVRAPRAAVRVAPAVFLAPVVWRPIVVQSPQADALVWQDAETIYKNEDWTEVTLNANARGSRLLLEVESGKAQLNFAEVVFENGDTRVVDFQENTRGQGTYPLLNFRDGRTVDHVRMVARAKSDEARLVLVMEN
jgi:hypothetical protein